MKKAFVAFVLAAAGLMSSAALAQNSEAIAGKWWNQEKDAQIEIYVCDAKYCGKIVWLKNPDYPADDSKGMGGKPRVDRENPEPSKRETPILGMNLLTGFSHSGGNLWEGGQIYDPREGKTYKCKMTLENPDRLKVRGFIGISLIGKTNEWARVK